ncbi:MAG: hypothetical protein CLLPBCKN_003384 [Chroococcidiopsis cubana SAG 39.79]|uniref:Uncharacterized protein n=1 Tax=Chroococcidiopsis cubana SAG 39.79 TaxID=388085 RepID=A0AB37UI54_9CYAN|nr:hypothetical protein [Chroococcidiopsis cubana]MDZ4873988.1 hypothetical protein [Chroococcidiopsis cubana SAG 39.79]PSB63365.1 hypothetical protein C7B79_14210 [Chroococcidiopsis cubana CCALA 043]RUT11055.1 hypothetical protein DSM107010_36890 [Chroococcidiopsis cubana SAG 39.79]
MKNRKPTFVKLRQQQCLYTGDRLYNALMESIRKPPEVIAKEFEQKVARKVEWLKKYDPHSVDIYLANPY